MTPETTTQEGMMADNESTVKVSLDAEAIQKQVCEAIIESSIGEAIKEGVENIRTQHRSAYAFQDSVDKAIKREVESVIQQLVHTELRPEIEKVVKETVTEKLIGDVVNRIWDKATSDNW